jgi:hypothetical protein
MKMTLKDEVFLCASPSFSGINIRYSFKETARESTRFASVAGLPCRTGLG